MPQAGAGWGPDTKLRTYKFRPLWVSIRMQSDSCKITLKTCCFFTRWTCSCAFAALLFRGIAVRAAWSPLLVAQTLRADYDFGWDISWFHHHCNKQRRKDTAAGTPELKIWSQRETLKLQVLLILGRGGVLTSTLDPTHLHPRNL